MSNGETKRVNIDLLAECAIEGWRQGRAIGASDDAIEAAVAKAFELAGASASDAALLSSIARDPAAWTAALERMKGAGVGGFSNV